MSLIGWAVMSIYLGTGLVYLPFRLILNWFQRPRKLDREKFENLKSNLGRELKASIEIANQLKGNCIFLILERKKDLQYKSGFFASRWEKSKINKEMKEFQKDLKQTEMNYGLFKLQLEFNKNNPVLYLISLILGILSIIFSLIVGVQM